MIPSQKFGMDWPNMAKVVMEPSQAVPRCMAARIPNGMANAIAITSDANPVYCSLDPRRGGRQAVAEAARNLACVGAEPLGLTDCLNFGSPENPKIAFQLSTRTE